MNDENDIPVIVSVILNRNEEMTVEYSRIVRYDMRIEMILAV